jgi:hypothetical protein
MARGPAGIKRPSDDVHAERMGLFSQRGCSHVCHAPSICCARGSTCLLALNPPWAGAGAGDAHAAGRADHHNRAGGGRAPHGRAAHPFPARARGGDLARYGSPTVEPTIDIHSLGMRSCKLQRGPASKPACCCGSPTTVAWQSLWRRGRAKWAPPQCLTFI